MSARILAYTYDSAAHCPFCTYDAYSHGLLVRSGRVGEYDEHGLPISMLDGEGNNTHPVFDTDDKLTALYCDSCGELID